MVEILKYSFKQQDMNNWKGRITESLIRFYIRDVLAPELEKEDWFKVFYLRKIPLGISSNSTNKYSRNVLSRLRWVSFLNKGAYPSHGLLEKCEKMNGLLEHSPDGFLLKLRKTGEIKLMKELVSELGIGKWKWSDEEDKCEFSTIEADETMEIPVVNGEIEVVEVKSDKGKLSKVQKKDYSNLVKNGYTLRLFHVRIVSFDQNHFEVKEKILKTIDEVEKGLRTL